jgi:MarR family 2-MHQ and catechol resistance regulon transcriptional repressor
MIAAPAIPASLTRAEFYPLAAAYMKQSQPEFSQDAVEVFFNLVFAYDAITAHFSRRFQRYDLTFPSFNMLMILNHPVYRDTGCPLSQLGELLLVSKANITGVMDSLEKRGLAERVDAGYDRRVKLAKITAQGKDLLNDMLPGHFRETKRVTKAMSKQEKHQLRDLLRKLRQSVVNAGEAPDEEA